MQKEFIRNRKHQKISVHIERSNPELGLVFVMHGLGGYKEQPHIRAITEVFRENSFATVSFDTTNSIGESDGKFEDATTTNYYEDLEDVIAWSHNQPWYQEPFVLAGHSLGGLCIALYVEKYPRKVRALVPISPVVSGSLTVEAHKRFEPEDYATWERTGWQVKESGSRPGLIKRLPWSHIVDRLRYDLLPQAGQITMPVLTIVGEKDTSIPPDHVQMLFNSVTGPKEMHVVQNAPHTFRDPKHLEEIQGIIGAWIEKYLRNST